MSPLVYIVRHGQTDWNAEARLQGQADTDINALGREQARRNGSRLGGLIGEPHGFDFVASPLRRTRETMELARGAMGLDPSGYRTDARLVELNFGAWQGSTLAEVDARHPGSTLARNAGKWNFLPPGAGAESYAMLEQRVLPFFHALARDTVCVTHGGVIRVLFRLWGQRQAEEAANLEVPQDKVLLLRENRLDWL